MKVWRSWVAFWSREEDPLPLAIFRVLVGAVVLHMLVAAVVSGSVDPIWVGVEHGGLATGGDHWLVKLLGGPSPSTVWELVTASMVLSAAVLVGFWTRLCSFGLLQACLALFSLHPSTGGGHDRLIVIALWMLALSPAGETLSLDVRRATGTWTCRTPQPAWTRMILVIQLCAMYTATGLVKQGDSWGAAGDRLAVYHALLLPSWRRYEDVSWVASVAPLTRVGTTVAWWWEATWPLVFLFFLARWLGKEGRWPDPRVPYVTLGVIVHGTLWYLLNLGPFSAITVSWYVLLFDADEWRALLGTSKS